MIYLDLLDSVKTAHPETFSSEWWRPNSPDEQEHSRELARAEMMIRLLHGDTIVLSNNQATDSVGWLQLSEDFSILNPPWEPIAMAAFGTQQITKDSLLEIIINYFQDPKFNLSAWVGIDAPLRNKVVENLKRHETPQFEKMFDYVLPFIDPRLSKALDAQAIGLQRFYEYLVRYQGRQVNLTAVTVANSIWPRMEKLRDRLNGIPGDILDEIKHFVGKDRLEFRSSLYNALAIIEEPMRSHVRKYVDRFYNEKMGLSVCKGRGVYTVTDHDPNTPAEEDEKIDALADDLNSKEGLLGRMALQFYPSKIRNHLKWDDFVKILADPEFGRSAHHLRTMLGTYDEISPDDPKYLTKYRIWLDRSLDALNQHHELLSKYLASQSIKSGEKLIIYIGAWTGAAIGSVLGGQVAYGLAGQAVGGSLSAMLYDAVKEKILPKFLVTTAAGRYRTALKEAVSFKSDEELLKGLTNG